MEAGLVLIATHAPLVPIGIGIIPVTGPGGIIVTSVGLGGTYIGIRTVLISLRGTQVTFGDSRDRR
jgi:hypothetical protein